MFKTVGSTNLETTLDDNLKELYRQLATKLPITGTVKLTSDLDMNGKAVRNPFNYQIACAQAEVVDEIPADEVDINEPPVDDTTGNGAFGNGFLRLTKQANLVTQFNPYTNFTPVVKADNLLATTGYGTGVVTTTAVNTNLKVTGTNLPEVSLLGDTTSNLLYKDTSADGNSTPMWKIAFPAGTGVDFDTGFTLSGYFSRQVNSFQPANNDNSDPFQAIIGAYRDYNLGTPQGMSLGVADKDRATGNTSIAVLGVDQLTLTFYVLYNTTFYFKQIFLAEENISPEFISANPTDHVQVSTLFSYQEGNPLNLFNLLRHSSLIGDANRRVYYLAVSWNPANPDAAILNINNRTYNMELLTQEVTLAEAQAFGFQPFFSDNVSGMYALRGPTGSLARDNSYIGKIRLWDVPLTKENMFVDFGKYL